jgi:hypothetical protein
MVDDREFSIGIKQAMTNPEYAERLRAAIDASPYMVGLPSQTFEPLTTNPET